jgi:competence protein ComEA
MKFSIVRTGLISVAFLFATCAAHASVAKPESGEKPPAGSQTAMAAKQAKGIKAKAVKAVDINSASKAELKTLRGIDDARADKIIAGRPYLSKAFLVTRNIVPAGAYQTIKGQIIARQ